MGEQVKYDPVTGKPIHEDFYTQPGNKLDQLANGFWDQVSLINSNQLKDALQSKLTNSSQIQKDQQALNDQVQLFKQQRAQQKLQNDAYWLSVAQKVNPNFKSLQDVMDWQEANGLVVDGKFGKNSLAKWEENKLNSTELLRLDQKEHFGNFEETYNRYKDIKAANKPTSKKNSFLTNLILGGAMAADPSIMIASGWRQNEDGNFVQDQQDDPGVKALRNNLAVLGGLVTAGTTGALLTPTMTAGSGVPALRQTAGIASKKILPSYGNALYDKAGNLIRFWKQGGHIKKHQQGGTMNEQEQIIRQVIQGINQGDPQIMQALSSLDKQQQQAILQSIAQLAQQGDQEAVKAINKIQNPQTAKLGTKLNYIKRLKGACPEGEELQYYKEGGMIKAKCRCKTLKASGGDTLTVKKQNPVQEFKSKKKKLDPTTTKTLPNGKYPENWTAADRAKWEEAHGNHGDIPEDFDANGGHKGEKWTPKKACGSKMKKN